MLHLASFKLSNTYKKRMSVSRSVFKIEKKKQEFLMIRLCLDKTLQNIFFCYLLILIKLQVACLLIVT